MVAVLLPCGLVMLLVSPARSEASVLVPVAQQSFVVTAALCFVFPRETLTRQGVGFAFAIAALLCLARS